ncbi:MAG: ADP-heptose synthase, partial [Gammaproteobacteria bacterium RIFCSPLOWO2_02_FULL_42_9]
MDATLLCGTDDEGVIDSIRSKGRHSKIVLVSGRFNILHPGHIRLLKFAKGLGDFLVVALEPDIADKTLLPSHLRLEALSATHYVDYVFVLQSSVADFIVKLKPHIVVKGSEFEVVHNPEEAVLASYGGKLVFGSGDIRFSSLDLLKKEFSRFELSSIEKPLDYLSRHNFNFNDLTALVKKFSSLKVLVIGDTIVDEYVMCDPLGMSQEDPTIVVTPISSDKFLGGAGIVAAHAAGLGAQVSFYSILGDDKLSDFVEGKMHEYHIDAHLYTDKTRETTHKQRFRANGKTLLRVNRLKQHHIDNELQEKIIEDIRHHLDKIDLLIFSDFSYGCLPKKLIATVSALALGHNIIVTADSQSSSQMGDISRFENMSLVTPTEREIRLAVKDFESGLIVLADKLRQKIHPKNIVITLGAEGMIVNEMQNSAADLL